MLNLRPKETALLVVDVQRHFCSSNGWCSTLPSRIGSLAESIADRGCFFVYTRSVGDIDRLPNNVRRFRQIHGYSNDPPSDSPASQLCPMFIPPGAIVIEKPCFDAFAHTSLGQTLRDWEIQHVLVAGVMTDVCVDATAKRAVMEGYNTCILSDLVAAPKDHEGDALRALKLFASYYGYVLQSTDLSWG